jgi:purine nucleosidase
VLNIRLDCDPGFDDWLTWLLLELEARQGRLQLENITITHGNAPFATVLANARAIRALHGFTTPIYEGARIALSQKLMTAQAILGSNGMRTVGLTLPPIASRAVAARTDHFSTIDLSASASTWLCTGPLTTMARHLAQVRASSAPIKIVWMGGSTDRGNHTPAAEFNAIADPQAAQAVFRAADLNLVHITMVGLNVCRPVEIFQSDISALRAIVNQSGSQGEDALAHSKRIFLDYLDGYQRIRSSDGSSPMSLYDPTALVATLHPEWFVFKPARVQVECHGLLTQGMTVVDFKHQSPNALVATQVDASRVKAWLFERLTSWLLAH